MSERLAYAAGIIDGEGSLSIWTGSVSKRARFLDIEVRVTHTNPALILWLSDHFGGKCFSYPTGSPAALGNRRAIGVWSLSRQRDLAIFLGQIAPHLVIKRQEVEIVIRALAVASRGGRGRCRSPEDWVELEGLRDELRLLRGKPANALGARHPRKIMRKTGDQFGQVAR